MENDPNAGNVHDVAEMLRSEMRTHPHVCRVKYYTEDDMFVECPCPKRCLNKYKYHKYKITDEATIPAGGDPQRSSHCSVIGLYTPIVLAFNENNHRAEKIPYGLNMETGRVYKRKQKILSY